MIDILGYWRAWKGLPAPVRAGIIRTGHALAGGLAAGTMEYYMHRDVTEALLLFVVSALTGQAALSHQLPRDPAEKRERFADRDREWFREHDP